MFNAASAVPPVPTLTAVDAVVTPELISPVILPVTFPVTLPVRFPVTFPVTGPTKLVDDVTPVTSNPPLVNVADVPTLTNPVTES